jgi:hypothetical protein
MGSMMYSAPEIVETSRIKLPRPWEKCAKLTILALYKQIADAIAVYDFPLRMAQAKVSFQSGKGSLRLAM